MHKEQKKKKILVVDDEESMRHMLSALLVSEGYQTDLAEDGATALRALAKTNYDFVLCDIRMPGMDGLTFLQKAVASNLHPDTAEQQGDEGRRQQARTEPGFYKNPDQTIIMMSAFGSVDTAIEAMKQGAYDYISKPFKADEIILVLKKAEERERLRQENLLLKKRIAGLEGPGGQGRMIGGSRVMQELFQLVAKVARHPTTVLVTGESGTGKELVARAIHENSPRKERAFVAVNCAAIPENLLESEFFGHVRGAFTGADRDRRGLFEEADGGTLFLDEIGELPLAMQVKLLRVLQDQEIRRVGGNKNIAVDVRIVAATSRNLSNEIQEGRFRQDLYYRLNVIHVHVPPLRERPGDLPLLCDYFVTNFANRFFPGKLMSIAPSAMKLLAGYDWPGNVRELENTIERAVILAEKNIILPENLPSILGRQTSSRRLDDLLGTFSIKEGKRILEKRLISRALDATEGNKSKAATLLEISYPSLLNKIKEYNIQTGPHAHASEDGQNRM